MIQFSDQENLLNPLWKVVSMKNNTPKEKIQRVLEYYSACDICQRDKTKVCEEKVPEKVKQTYFMTILPRWEDAITKRCKYFRLHKGKMENLFKQIESENW